jgi:hypothetical protein
MAYTPPLGNVAHIDLARDGGGAYTPPAGNVAHIDFVPLDTLIGRTATISQGTIVPRISVTLVGQSMTATQGSISVTRGASLVGQAATISQGTIVGKTRTPNPIIWAYADPNVTLSGSPQRTADCFSASWAVSGSNGGEEEVGGKRYFEVALTGKKQSVGISNGWRATSSGSPLGMDTAGGDDLYTWAMQIDFTAGNLRTCHDGTATAQGTYTYVAGAPIQVAVDFAAGKIWFGYNGTWVGGGSPFAGTNPTYTGVTGFPHPVLILSTAGQNVVGTAVLKVSGNDFDFPLNVFGSTGFLPWQDSNVDEYGVLVGQQLTASQGAMVPSTIVLSGQQATISGGTLTPSITNGATLVGLQATAKQSHFSSVVNAGNVIVFPFSAEQGGITASSGGFAPSINIGTSSNALAPIPKVTSAYGNTTAPTADPFYTASWTYKNTFTSFEGSLRGVGEVARWDIYGNQDFRARGGYELDQIEKRTGTTWSATLTESWDYCAHGDSTIATYELTTGSSEPWYLNRMYDFPYTGSNRFNRSPPNAGGNYCIALDGTIHKLYQRDYWDGATLTNYYAYQNNILKEGIAQPGDILGSKVFTATSGTLMGLYAHTFDNAYIFFLDTSNVLTYRRWNGATATFGSEVSLTGWTGSTANTPDEGYISFVRTGYGDTIYITYVTTGDTAGRYLGLIVFNAVTESVTSHTLTHATDLIGSYATIGSNSSYYYVGHRPVQEVARLSSGTSVTQFLLKWIVANLSWTSGTATTPTLTLKTPPATAYDGIAPGWETLEVRGDTVQHILYDIDFRAPISSKETETAVYPRLNDATGTGSTWSAGYDLFHFGDATIKVPDNGASLSNGLFLSGYGGGGATYLFYSSDNQHNGYVPGMTTGKAWLDWWSGISIAATGRVGRVTITIIPGVVLTGQAATISQGALKPSITVALTGLSTTVLGGTLVGGVPHDATVTLTGLSMTAAQGSFVIGRGAALAGISATVLGGTITSANQPGLTGAALTSSVGVLLPTITVALTGLSTTISGGILGKTVAVVLAGQQAAVSGGTLTRSTANSITLAGLQAIITGGNFTSVVAGVPAGLAATATGGALYATLAVPLTSLSAAINRGSLGFFYDCNLFPSGVQAIGVVGTIGPMSPLPLAGTSLWTNTGQADLFTHVPIEPLNNDA